MARTIVHTSLQMQPGERVIVHADPTFFPELTEQVRIEINRAGAIELCTMMLDSPGLDLVRQRLRRREDPALKEQEDRALAELFALADVYIWLPNDWAEHSAQTEDIIRNGWPGRSVHFHWASGWWPPARDPALFAKLSAMYQDALFIDYAALAAHQERIVEALQDSTVEVTTPRGTDLRFTLAGAHFHRNNGDASKRFVDAHSRPGSARDREEELPAGGIRTVDLRNAEGRLVVPNETYPAWTGPYAGTLTFELSNDRITAIASEFHDEHTQAMWALETGDKDRIGEFIIGTNPKLTLLPGYDDVRAVPYFGFGAGVVRFSMGNNLESGGTNDTSFLHNWCFLTDATVKANGTLIIENGDLVLP
jgi:leucyl aminopeptidase (aminopeptidase T)